MRLSLFLLVIGCPVLVSFGPTGLYSRPPSAEVNVRSLLNGVEFKDESQQLIEMGEKVFPTFEAILSDPDAKPNEVSRIFGVLCEVKADRYRFVGHTVCRLADPSDRVRWAAVELLGRIGTFAEAFPVVALLSDSEKVVVNAAAKALSAIGGPQEVIAIDVWLQGVSHRDDAHLRHRVKQCRDELQKRLDKARGQGQS